jgi:hypothetical protein
MRARKPSNSIQRERRKRDRGTHHERKGQRTQRDSLSETQAAGSRKMGKNRAMSRAHHPSKQRLQREGIRAGTEDQ